MLRRVLSVAAVAVIVLLVGALAVYAGYITVPGATPSPTSSPTATRTFSPPQTPSPVQGSPSIRPSQLVTPTAPTPTAVPTPIDPNIHANAIVVPIHSAELAMAVDGIVSTIYVKEADQVTVGELLLTLDQTKYLSDIEVASSAVRQAQA